VVGRNQRRRQATRQAQVRQSGRRQDRARVGRPHLRRRTRPTARRLHRMSPAPVPNTRSANSRHGPRNTSPRLA